MVEIKGMDFEVDRVTFRHLRNGNRTQLILERPYDEDEHAQIGRLNGKRLIADMVEDVSQNQIEFEDETEGE